MSHSSNSYTSSSDWCLIESDPAVFTELLEMLGCAGVEFAELYSLDDESLSELSQQQQVCYGLIFLFEWKAANTSENAAVVPPGSVVQQVNEPPLSEDQIPPNLFFAHQVTTNACATQAVLSVLLNAANEGKMTDEDLGKVLSDFRSFTSEFPPNLKGVAISSSEEIRAAHNSFAPNDSFLSADKHYDRDAHSAEAFHFVAYVPVGDAVYELDGLQNGPIVLPGGSGSSGSDSDSSSPSSWLQTARTAIQERMRQTGADAGAVKFNLMAVIQDKRIALRGMLDVDPENHAAAESLQHEEQKRRQWKCENQRHRHNYVSVSVQLLKELARAGQLNDLVAEDKQKQAARRRAALLKKQSSSS